MFTGLIEALGEVAEIKPTTSGCRLRLTTPLARELASGDSLAVNGVCLTVVAADEEGVHADIAPETARVTTLGGLKRGTVVNLERPVRADGRMGGHFVQGHVDATASIEEVRKDGDSYWITVKFPPPLAPYIVRKGSIAVDGISLTVVRKGSIAVDGISLTVAGVDEKLFDVQVIPYTWEHTTFQRLKSGDVVNLECDIIGKYVVRAAQLTGSAAKVD